MFVAKCAYFNVPAYFSKNHEIQISIKIILIRLRFIYRDLSSLQIFYCLGKYFHNFESRNPPFSFIVQIILVYTCNINT